MVEWLWARLASKGAIVRKDRLLLLHRRDDIDLWPGLWDLPGGGVEKDGDLVGTLVREVLDETGFRVRVGPVLDVSFAWVKVRSEPRFPSVVVSFRCLSRSRAAPRLDRSEHSDFAWVSKRELGRVAVVPRLKRAMESALLDR
jgi:8-oxo-dGTP diphosphatase